MSPMFAVQQLLFEQRDGFLKVSKHLRRLDKETKLNLVKKSVGNHMCNMGKLESGSLQ